MEPPELASDEETRFAREGIRLAIFKSGINYRAVPTLPLLQDIGCWITDRRVVIRGELLLNLYDRDISFWFPGHQPEESAEIVTRVEHGEAPALGEYLVIRTRADKAHRFRKKDASWQVFLDDASALMSLFPKAIVAD